MAAATKPHRTSISAISCSSCMSMPNTGPAPPFCSCCTASRLSALRSCRVGALCSEATCQLCCCAGRHGRRPKRTMNSRKTRRRRRWRASQSSSGSSTARRCSPNCGRLSCTTACSAHVLGLPIVILPQSPQYRLGRTPRGHCGVLQGQSTRRTPLGFDRHWNRYWLLGGTDDGGSPKLFVERMSPVQHGEVSCAPCVVTLTAGIS